MSGTVQKPGFDGILGFIFEGGTGARGTNRRISRFGPNSNFQGNRMFKRHKVVRGTTIAFVNATQQITDSLNRLDVFEVHEFIAVHGGLNQDFLYTPVVVTPGVITTLGAPVEEPAGTQIRLSGSGNKRVPRFAA